MEEIRFGAARELADYGFVLAELSRQFSQRPVIEGIGEGTCSPQTSHSYIYIYLTIWNIWNIFNYP